MAATSGMAEAAISAATGMPRFGDGSIDLREVLRQPAESVVDEAMGAEADQLCEATGNSGNGYRERMLTTCVGTPPPGVPRLRPGGFLPEDVLERHRRSGRAVVAAVAATGATGASTRKVQRVASAMGVGRMSRDQAGAICAGLGSEVEELPTRPLGDLPTPCPWLDETHVRCRRSGRVASTAVVAATGCDPEGRGHVLGLGVVDTEGHDSWSAFLGRVGERGARSRRPSRGTAWQRCAVRTARDCARAASGPGRTSRRVPGIVAPVFRLGEAGAVRAAHHLAIGMLGGAARRRRASWRRPGPTRRPTSTSRRATGSACAPTTCRGAPIGR